MKDKTKKVLKTIGLVVLSLLATLGVVLGGLLIGEMGKGNTKPVLMEEERTSFRSPVKRKPDFTAEGYNLLEKADIYSCYIVPSAPRFSVEKLSGYSTYYMSLEAGYYYYDRGSNPEGTPCFTYSSDGIAIWLNAISTAEINSSITLETDQIEAWGMVECANYSNFYFYMANDGYFSASSRNTDKVPNLYLVDTAKVPASSRITFSESFSPLGLFSSSLTSNNGFAYIPNNVMEPYNPSLTLSGVLFRYGGVVYDYIYIELENASDWGYIDEDGLVHKGHSWGGESGYYYAVGWVRFGRSYLGESGNDGTVVVNADLKNVDGNNGVPVFTGRTSWVNREVRTIEVIDNKGLTTGRYNSRYDEMTDLQVLDFFSLSTSSAYSVVGNVGDGNIFTLLTSAFESVLPVLNIAILPNITLGLLILLPLVAGAIVLIIRAVKK